MGAARLSPERTGKLGMPAQLGSGDGIGRAAPDLLLVWRLLLKLWHPATASRRRGRRLAVSRDRKRSRTEGNRGLEALAG